jgi:hypothetical protein
MTPICRSVKWRASCHVSLLSLLITFAFNAGAQTTYYSRANNVNWNLSTSWSTVGHASATNAGTFPVAGDIAIIGNSNTIHVNVNSACASLQLGSSTTNNLGAIDFTAAVTLTVSGNIQLGGAGNSNRDGTITFASGSTVSAGSVTIGNAGGTPGQGTITMTAGGTLNVAGSVTVNGAGNVWTRGTGLVQLTATNTLPNALFNNFNNLTINGGTTSLAANITVAGAMNITSGTIDAAGFTNTVTGLTTVNGGTYLASTSTQAFNGGLAISNGTFTGSSGTVSTTDMTLSSTGTLTAPSGTFNVSGNWSIAGGTFTPGANTVIFTKAAGTQTLNSGGAAFNNISHTGAGTLQLITNALSVNGTFATSAGTFDANGQTNTVTGLTTVSISGTSYLASSATQTLNGGLTVSGGTFTASSGAVTTGTGTLTVSGGTFSGSLGTVTVTDVSIINGTLTAPSGSFNVLGNWSKAGGTFTPGTNTVTFTKTSGTQTIASGASAFYNVSHTGAGVLQLITNNLSATGSFSNSGGDFDSNGRTNTVTGIATLSGGTYLSPTALQTFNGGLTIAGGIYAGSTGGLTVTDILITSGTLTAPSGAFNVTTSFINNGGTFTPGANTVTFSGAGAKSISGSSAITFQNVAMNTTAAAVVNVDRSITINGTLSWTADGLIVVGSTSDLTLGSSAIITSPNGNRYIQVDGVSTANSQLIRVNDNTTAKWQFLFPIGTSTGGYSPLNMSTATVTTAPTLNSTLAVKAILGTDVTGRLKRTFRMTVAGNSNATTFSGAQFSYSTSTDISSGDSQASYNTFWYEKESTGSWTALTGTAPGTTFFTGPSVAQTLADDTYYFTIGSSIAYGGSVWYSYQSGNWNDPLSWTTDGSLFPLYVNPTSTVPGAADNVVITSGRTISMNVNNVSITSITVTGTLDLLASTGHNFTTVSGAGRIKMSAAADNFPSGTATNFADSAVGGTIEINGTGMSLNQTRTFNNMVINMTGSSDIATLLNTITLNGDLTVTNGLLQFNDNATVSNRTMSVNGDVTIASTGGIRTGTANARHEFNLYGDFTNNGTAYFTNRTTANMAAEATDGIVDVNFLSSTQDQQASCNGVTRFYRIEITKGTDDTYIANISASNSTYFNLFGAANYDINEANAAANSNGTNLNALGLNSGTVELGTNVTVILNTVSNYAIYEGAQLWINGATVSKSGGTAVVPYGTVRVSAGSLTVDLDSGLTLRVNGVIKVDGGTVTVRAIRTSTAGSSAVGSYIQSGGNVYVTGGIISVDYAAFSLTYTGNVFNMSGGTLTVRNRVDLGTSSLRGAIFINSDPANISVTGGTVVMEATSNVSYRVTSRAAFWNVIMRKTAGSNTTIELAGTTSGTGTAGVDELTLAAQPLTVLNDFTVEGSTAVTFLTNNQDVTVSGNLQIQTGATYTPGTNTTTITGLGVSSLSLGTGATQSFNNLTINKSSASSEAVIIAGNSTALRATGTLTVSQGIFDYSSFIVSARATVTLASGVSVGKSAGTGKLLLDGTVDQTLNSSGAAIYNLELNNTDATPVITLATGNLTIYKTLTLTGGIFNIATNKLTMSGSTAAISGSGFSATKMIQTSANTSDSGLELYLDANETLTFPLGVSGKYTPVTASFTGFSDDGLVRINPVNGILQTTNLSGGSDILAYYWRVSSSNFSVLPSVSYTFTYQTADVGGTEANYVPGKVLDISPFTRSFENDVTKVNDGTNVITFNGSGSGFTLEDANYTAGGSGRFTGTVKAYYTRKLTDAYSQSWTDGTLWTLGTNGLYGVHDSRQTSAGTSPGVGDIAVIGWVPFGDPTYTNGSPHGVSLAATQSVAEVRFTQMLDAGGSPTTRVYYENFQFRPTLCLNNNGSGNQGQLASGTKVSGEGMFWNRSTGTNLSDPAFTGVDLGAFNLQDSSYMLYENTLTSATYSNMPSSFPNLMMSSDGWGANDKSSTLSTTITVNGNMELLGDINLVLSTTTTGDVTVNKNLKFFRSNANGNDSGGGGELRFGNTGTARTVNVLGDLVLGNGYAALISIPSPGTTPISHTINLYGNFTQNTTSGNGFKAGTSSTNDRIQVNLLGSTSMTLSNTAGDAPQFYSLTVNKGSSISTTATFNSNFTINGPTNAATKSLVLTNGLFVINHASASVVLTSGGANFNIPSTAGLEVSLGTISTTTASTNANITLDGLLRISGGTATIDSGAGFANYIEYSNSGNATIEVTGGTLTVGGQVRRGTSSITGVLKYTQSSGTVVIGNRGSLAATRGVFEVLNTGSQFNHSGGTLTIVRGNGSSTVPSVWLEPASSSITSGSTITIGNASTPAGSIGIQSTATLNNLSISGLAASSPTTKIYISPLTVNGNITVSASNTLDAQGLDFNVGGNFTIDGTYTSGNNTTTFTNAGAAAISGSTPALSFYDFTKTGAGTLTLSKDITINRDLQLSAGILATTSFAINLKRHAEVDATITSTSGSGLIFNGTAQQQLSRSVSGTGTIGIITVNNSSGVIIPDGNGYDFSISNNLRLQSGVFDIGGSLLALGASAVITPVTVFSITNMIQTNSSFTDKGVKKQFSTNYTTNFTFPVGQLNYTPVIFDFSSAGNTTGSSGTPTITVRPANERHPSVIDDNGPGELPSPAAFNDLNNVLQYYWIINADNVASTFKSTMTLQYTQSLVSVVSPYTEADYLSARILSDANPTILINKFNTTDVNETSNTITFALAGVDSGISGDYFAGIDVAIPDNVPIYTTTTSGNVNDVIYTPAVIGGGAPAGALVIVQSGHTLTFNISDVSLYETQINAGAKLVIPSGSIGHRLGNISGTGDLEIDSNTGSAVLPAAEYDVFFSCAGGGLVYGGSGTYDILGSINTVRNLTLEGAGTKTLANNDITICNDFTLNGGTFSNSNARTITVQNDVLLNSSTFNSLAGTLTITGDLLQTAGSFNGGTAHTKTIGSDLNITGGSFTPGSGSSNIIRVNGNMTVADAATIISGTGGATGQRFTFGGTSAQTLTGTFTGTRAFNRFEISNSSGLTLTGNTTVNSELLLTSGLITPGTYTFLLSTSAVSTPTEGISTSFVNGKLYKVMSSGASFTFPIGKNTKWRTGSLNSVSASTTWDMEYIDDVATGVVANAPAPRNNPVNNFTSSDATILTISNGEYWKVSDGTATSSGKTAKVGLSWGVESDVSTNTAQREALKVMSWNGTNWTNNGGDTFSPGHTQSRGTFLSTGTLSFSENIVTLGSTEVANPLPISLAWFKGEIVGSEAYLYWRTESELNNNYFEIQRSGNGNEFEAIGTVQGQGNSIKASDYIFEDKSLHLGKNYYRLKQVDFDGQSVFSETIVLEYTGLLELDLFVFPNPTTSDNINFKLSGTKNGETQIRLFDLNGKIIYKAVFQSEELNKELLINAGDLKQGLYIIEAIQGKGRITQRVIVK